MAKAIRIILAFFIILGIFVSFVTVFASSIAVDNQNPEMGDNGPGIYMGEVFSDTPGLNNDGNVLSLMAGSVIIIEVYPDTYISGDTAGEFVGIHNPTENSISLGGWQITDLIKGSEITFPKWANISAGDSLYLAYNATVFYDEMLWKADFEYGDDSDQTPNMDRRGWGLKLNNKGDKVILKNDRDAIIDVVVYGDADYIGFG